MVSCREAYHGDLQSSNDGETSPSHSPEEGVEGEVVLSPRPFTINGSGSESNSQCHSPSDETQAKHQLHHLATFHSSGAIERIDTVVECSPGALVLPRLIDAEHDEHNNGEPQDNTSKEGMIDEGRHRRSGSLHGSIENDGAIVEENFTQRHRVENLFQFVNPTQSDGEEVIGAFINEVAVLTLGR